MLIIIFGKEDYKLLIVRNNEFSFFIILKMVEGVFIYNWCDFYFSNEIKKLYCVYMSCFYGIESFILLYKYCI